MNEEDTSSLEYFLPQRRKGTVRILAFSDWRVQDYGDLLEFVKLIPTCNLIVYAGDNLDRLTAPQDVVRQVVGMTAGRLLFVAGNYDVPEDRALLVDTCLSTRLKDLAHELGFKFRHPGIDKMSVSFVSSKYLETGRRLRSWKPYLKYNQDDVAATGLVLNSLKAIVRA